MVTDEVDNAMVDVDSEPDDDRDFGGDPVAARSPEELTPSGTLECFIIIHGGRPHVASVDRWYTGYIFGTQRTRPRSNGEMDIRWCAALRDRRCRAEAVARAQPPRLPSSLNSE